MGVDSIQLKEGYNQLKWRIMANPKEVDASTVEIIDLDVLRSREQLLGIDSDALRNVLLDCALHNPEIKYV